MELVRKSFLQGVERFQVAVRLDTVVGRIAFASRGFVQSVEKLVLTDCQHVNTFVVLGIDVNAEDARMRFKTFFALLLELAAGRYGGEPSFGFLGFGLTVGHDLGVEDAVLDVLHVLDELHVALRDVVSYTASRGGFED